MKKYVSVKMLLPTLFVFSALSLITESGINAEPLLDMRPIPAGTFEMGSDAGGLTERPLHSVKLGAFEMSGTEVTTAQYQDVIGDAGSVVADANKPAVKISWFEAAVFCNRLSEREGYDPSYDEDTWLCDFRKNGYRLPTEAEWEYACRAGTKTPFYTGETDADIDRAGWYLDNSDEHSHSVAEKEANEFKLYDMHGNVWEWCNDWYGADYYETSAESNPRGPAEGFRKVVRGGSWLHKSDLATSTIRGHDLPSRENLYTGFRVVRKEPSGNEPSLSVIQPAENDVLVAGTTYTITWESQNIVEVALEYSVDGQNEWTQIGTFAAESGSFEWMVPAVETEEARIRIFDASDTAIMAFGGYFAIRTKPKKIMLLSPNGGEHWTAGTVQSVTWETEEIESINIEYTIDGGSSWHGIGTNITAASSSFQWYVPDDVVSGDCLVRISDSSDDRIQDESDEIFGIVSSSVRIVSPASGDSWTAGSEKEIVWEFGGAVTTVRIELSLDDGATWQIIKDAADAQAGSYLWTVPETVSFVSRIRISDAEEPAVNDISEAFEIFRAEVTINHQPIVEAAENEALTFRAKVMSASDIDRVVLHYDLTGRREFNTFKIMELSDNNIYMVTLDSGIFTAEGMEYYITALDTDGNKTRAPLDVGIYSIIADVSGISSEVTVKGGSEQSAYRMVSVPLFLDEQSIVNQISDGMPQGEYGEDWRLFRYYPGEETASEYPDIEGFAPGNAFWYIGNHDFTLKLGSGTTVPSSEPYSIVLKAGWNDIANPWMFPIAWDRIEIPSQANISMPYTYTGVWSDPGDMTTLEPWQGYAVRNNENFNVLIKLYPIKMGKIAAKPASDENELAHISLSAHAGEAQDIGNHAVIHRDARKAWDTRDMVEPPPVGQYVRLLFPHKGWEQYPYDYTVDARPPEFPIEWNFEVETNIEDEKVTVSLEGLEHLPSDWNYTLTDAAGNAVQLHDDSFSFQSNASVTAKQYSLVINNYGRTQQEDNKPSQFITASCYPNPFNARTTISYDLAEQTKVRIDIFNALGQRIMQYDLGRQSQGRHAFILDAESLTSGLYFYQISSGNVHINGKMLYLK